MTIVQIPNLEVTNEEIRISRLSGYISMLEVDITLNPKPKSKESIKLVKTKRGFTVFLNCSLIDTNTDCVFEPEVIPDVKCAGILVRVPSDEDIEIACKMICQKPGEG